MSGMRMRKRGRTEVDSDRPEPDRPVKRFSKSEVQRLINQEVQDAVKQTETQMDSLLEKVQQLECEPKYDLTIRQLEAHIKKVKRRGDAAIACVRKSGTTGTNANAAQSRQSQGKSGPSNTEKGNGTVDLSRSDSEEDLVETTTNKDPTAHGSKKHRKSVEGFWKRLMTTTKVVELTNGKGAAEGKEEETENNPSSSSSLSLSSAPPVMKPVTVKQEPVVSLVKIECSSPERAEQEACPPLKTEDTHTDPPETGGQANEDEYTLSEQDKDDLLSRLPPHPPTPFPSTLQAMAASYCIPQKPFVSFARIRHPPSLGVMWDIKKKDSGEPPIDSYSIFMAQESSNGSGVYPEWRRLGVVSAIPMPMAIAITEYRPGRRMCFIVVGKDTFGRYGPYSDVESVVL